MKNITTDEEFKDFMRRVDEADRWDDIDDEEYESACRYAGTDYHFYHDPDVMYDDLKKKLDEIENPGKTDGMNKYTIYVRRTDDEFTADGYGEWDDGHDWETEGTAEDAVNEFIDHLVEEACHVRRIDKDEIVYDGDRMELKVEEREDD